MSTKDLFVSVIVPCCNSGGDLGDSCRRILRLLHHHFTYFEVIIIDDGSRENGSREIDSLLNEFESVRYIRLSRRHGVDICVSAGLDSAIGDYVVVLDAITDPPELIPELVTRCQKAPGLHYGVLDQKHRGRAPRLTQRLLSWLFASYCARFLGIDVQRKSGIFRIFSRQAVNIFTQTRDRSRLLRLMSANLGLPAYKFVYQPLAGKRLVPPRRFFDDVDMAFDILVATSRHPLRFVSRLGILLAGLNFIYAIYILLVFVFKSHVAEGWVTLSFQSAVMFFFLFTVLAMMGEYIGKILFENQQRSPYTVLEERNSSVLINANRRRNIVLAANE